MKYIPTSSLLSMRLVCKEWKEYLDNSNHWKYVIYFIFLFLLIFI